MSLSVTRVALSFVLLTAAAQPFWAEAATESKVQVCDLVKALQDEKGCKVFKLMVPEKPACPAEGRVDATVHPDRLRNFHLSRPADLGYVAQCVEDLRDVLKANYPHPCHQEKDNCAFIKDATRALAAGEGVLRRGAYQKMDQVKAMTAVVASTQKQQALPNETEGSGSDDATRLSVSEAAISRLKGNGRTTMDEEKPLTTREEPLTTQEESSTPQDATAPASGLQGSLDELKAQLIAIDQLVNLTGGDVIANQEAYPNTYFRLPVGYEFVDIEKGFDEGFPNLGMLTSVRFGGSRVHDGTHGFRGGRYGASLSFQLQWTNSAEQKIGAKMPEDPAGPSGTPSEDPPPEDGMSGAPMPEDDEESQEAADALLLEGQAFFPLFRSRNNNDNDVRLYFGPTFTVGGRKTDGVDQLDWRYYGGLRFAVSPETFFDLLYGRTDSLESDRTEVRFQIPIGKLDNNSRAFIGVVANLGLGHEKDAVLDTMGQVVRPEEGDTIRVFLQMNGDPTKVFSAVFASFNGK